MVPVWISLPRLPLQCFAPEFLESIANRIGRFLCLDKATATLARPSTARICIELDLRKARPQCVLIDLFEGHRQPIVYERLPKFCMGCHVQGHTNVECSKNTLDTLQSKDSGPIPADQERSQAVRRNAKESSAAVSHVIPDQSRVSSFAAVSALLSASDLPHQDPPRSPSAAASSEHQLGDPLPLPPPPSHPPLPAAAQQLSAVQPLLQSTVAAATLPPLIPPPSISTVAAATLQLCDPLPLPPPPSQPLLPADSQNLPAVQTLLQSSVAAATHPPLIPPPYIVEAISSSAPFPSSAVSHVASVQHPLSSKVQLNDTSSVSAPAAVPSPALFLSAQAAPFSPSDPVQSVQQTSALNNQHSTSSLRVYYNKNGAKYITALPQPGRPWEMVNCQLGNQGHLSSIINAPSLSYNHHQIHALEGYDSEGSFETDSQPNSPLESPKEDANKCPFPPQSGASEGEQPTEDHPGLQGHISDVEFYHRPMSSKKNKRQPDGPLRVQLRTRKGFSLHK